MLGSQARTGRRAALLLTVARAVAAVCLLLHAAILTGAVARVDVARVLFAAPPASANECLALLMLSASLACASSSLRVVRLLGQALALVAVASGALTIVQWLAGMDLGIDGLFVSFDRLAGAPSRMPFQAAVTVFVLGLALAAVDLEVAGTWRASEVLASAATFVAMRVGLAHLYGGGFVSDPWTGMPIHVALTLAALGISTLFLRPDRGAMAVLTGDDAAGFLGRRLVPAALALPVLLSFLPVVGRSSGFFDFGAAMSLFTAVVVASFVGTAWFSALGLGRAERAAAAAREVEATLDLERRMRLEEEKNRRALLADVELRRRTERRLSLQYAVARALGEAQSLAAGVPAVLGVIGDQLDWSVGCLWTVDRTARVLRSAGAWRRTSCEAGEFIAASAASSFEAGKGLPGRVWGGAEPTWIRDVSLDTNFPRAAAAARAGLHTAVGFPILLGKECIGTVEFFTEEIREPDESLLEVMAAVGQQIGQFLERKRAEDEVSLTADRLRAALEESESAGRAKDEFLAMLGHELRNPIGAIRTSIETLRRIETGRGTEDRLHGIIARQTETLRNLVDDLLDVSRLTSGKIRLRTRAVDLKEVVESALDSARADRKAERHRLLFAGESVFVQGDPVRLEQIVANLVDNALKYTPAGGEISVTVRKQADEAVLRVRDNGHGIEPELLPRIFDLFAQGRQPLDRSRGGLGLGLTLVRRLAEMHGGRVEAESAGKDTGSEFRVRFPATEPAAQAPSPSDTLSPGPRRVLVVEDHADSREALRVLLESSGNEVEALDNGRSGVERILAARPDVALVDIGLPELDGYEVARQVRAAERDRRSVLVAITGYGQALDRRRALEAGFDEHLVKPIDPHRLAAILAAAPRERAAS